MNRIKKLAEEYSSIEDIELSPASVETLQLERLGYLNGYLTALGDVMTLVNEQAEDEGLWSVPLTGQQSIMEAYLQQELRRLHAHIEALRGEEDDNIA